MNPIELVAPVEAVEVNGEQIVIKPFTFGQLPAVAKRISAITATIQLDEIRIEELFAEGGEDVLHIIAMACGKPRVWLDTVDMGKGIELLSAVVTLNKEQFVKKLLPALTKMMTGLARKQG